ncbi:LYPLA2 [Symbiodinium pilosum]|uniref:LYPLA2 protein n=1 Tax=Symbiodinium pilosum TaxID=2952 RepID=A0A812XJY3_SYMPI|nr:LYPLA2 [Symbiodinium pilosum]
MEAPQESQGLVMWLHGLQSCGCHIKKMLISTRILKTLPWVQWRFPESDVGELSILPGQRMKSWFDLPEQPIMEARSHRGMQEAVDRVHGLLYEAIEQGFVADRILLCGFSQGGALALQAGLTFPKALAGICAVASWTTADLPYATEKNTLPILMCHGSDDVMVPIEVARKSCKSLAMRGYSKVNLVTFKGLRHQLISHVLEETLEFVKQLLPCCSAELAAAVPLKDLNGCLIWLHDATVVGEVDEALMTDRTSKVLPLVHLQLVQLSDKEAVKDGLSLLSVVTAQLQKAKSAGFAAERTVLGGFGAGGTAALLTLPRAGLAGLVCSCGYASSGLPPQVSTGEDELIVVLHGLEDDVVPIEVAREQWQVLGSRGYRGVAFNAMKGLRHEFTMGLWQDVLETVEAILGVGADGCAGRAPQGIA